MLYVTYIANCYCFLVTCCASCDIKLILCAIKFVFVPSQWCVAVGGGYVETLRNLLGERVTELLQGISWGLKMVKISAT